MSERIGVIGGSGLIGSRTVDLLRQRGVEVITPTSSEVNITNRVEVEEFIGDLGVDTVLLLAAYTNVDGAEDEVNKAREINVMGVKNVANAVEQCDGHLEYVSTDFVFSGTISNPGPYSENNKTANIDSLNVGQYARTKIEAENFLRTSNYRHAIIRVAYPFGNPESPKDFVNKTITYIKNGYQLFTDQRLTPTFIPDFARAVEVISKKKLTGIYHVATHPITSPYEFGVFIADRIGSENEVKSGSMAQFLASRQTAPRPIVGGLTTVFTEAVLGIKFNNWREAVDEELKLLS